MVKQTDVVMNLMVSSYPAIHLFVCVFSAADSSGGVSAVGEGAEEEEISSLGKKLGKVKTQEENNST